MAHPPSAFLSAGVLALIAGSASAQIDVYRLGIPDFDQRREALFGSGEMYSCPTSCMNLYAYAANHGIPNATIGVPGPRNWAAAANYNAATFLIDYLGNRMQTSSVFGTSGLGAESGLNIYNNNTGSIFTADIYWATGRYAPSPADLASHMLLGGLVGAWYGRYEFFGSAWVRNGGHKMSLVGVQNNGGEILVRDPAADEGNVAGRLTMQSPFHTEKYTMQAVTANFRYPQEFPVPADRTQYRLVEKGDGYFLDAVAILWPQMCITPVTVGTLARIKVITPLSLTNEPQEDERLVPVASLIDITDAAIALDKAHVYFAGHITRTAGGLYRLNRVTDEVVQVVPLGDPGKLCVDRHGKIWAADGSVIKIVTDNGLVLPAVQTLMLPLGSTPDDLFFNDASDQMHILSTSDDRLFIAGVDGGITNNWRLPAGVDLVGDGSVCPSDPNKVWLAHQADGIIRECLPSAVAPTLILLRTISLPGVNSIRSMQLDDQGHLFISNGATMHEFMEDFATMRWVPVPNSMWTGRAASSSINFGRSRTNYNASVMSLSDVDILNPEPGNGGSIPDCAADINFDGFVNPDDLADFITMFFTPRGRFFDRRVDFNQDGFVDPDDLADFITAFFLSTCG